MQEREQGWSDGLTLDQVLQVAMHDAHIEAVAACIYHDLRGPVAAGTVFSTCTKCGGRFKVQIEDD